MKVFVINFQFYKDIVTQLMKNKGCNLMQLNI